MGNKMVNQDHTHFFEGASAVPRLPPLIYL